MAAPDAHDTPVKTSNIQLIGNTPLLEFARFESDLGLKARVYGKIEAFNLTGSIKDRAALYMIEAAEREGKLKPGSTIIEPTSGNTGIALSAIGSAKGYKVILVMPDTMSVERRRLMKAYGAEIVLTDGAKGISGSIEKPGNSLRRLKIPLCLTSSRMLRMRRPIMRRRVRRFGVILTVMLMCLFRASALAGRLREQDAILRNRIPM